MNGLCLVILCLFSVKRVSPTIHAKVDKPNKSNREVRLTLGEPPEKDTEMEFKADGAKKEDWGGKFKPGFLKMKPNSSIKISFDLDVEVVSSNHEFSDSPETTEFIVYYGFSWEGYVSEEAWLKMTKHSSKKLNFHVFFLDPKSAISGWAGLVVKPIAIPEEQKMALDIEVACGTFDEASKEVLPKGEVFAKTPNVATDRHMKKFSGSFNFDPNAKAIALHESDDHNNKTTFVDNSKVQFMKVDFLGTKFQISKAGFANVIFPMDAPAANLEISSDKPNSLTVKSKANRII